MDETTLTEFLLKWSDCQEKHGTLQYKFKEEKLEKLRKPVIKKSQNKESSAQMDHFYRDKTN